MAIPEGYKAVAAIVPEELHDEFARIAANRDTSVSKILGSWMRTGMVAPVKPARRDRHSVRAYKDELMLSLPREFIRANGLTKDDHLLVSWGGSGLVIAVERPKES